MRALSPLLLVLAAGCATSDPDTVALPGGRPAHVAISETSMEVNISPDRAIVTETIRATPEVAWAALQKAYGELGIEVKESDPAARVLGNPRLILSRRLASTPLSRYLSCGQGLQGYFADTYRIEMLIRSSIAVVEGSGTRVNTYLEATARNPEGTSNTAVACTSTQRLEREIAARVKLHAEGE